MKKKTKNWITHIMGLSMMVLGTYMLYIEKPITYTMLMFSLGAVSFISFNKLGDSFLNIIKSITKTK